MRAIFSAVLATLAASAVAAAAMDGSKPVILKKMEKGSVKIDELSVYLAGMGAHWDSLDRNKDGILEWQGMAPKEPLSSALNKCFVVSYALAAAVDGRDPKSPGVYLNKPERWEPNGWATFAEVLAAASAPTNECTAFDQTDEPYCAKDGKKQTYQQWVMAGNPALCGKIAGGAFNKWSLRDCSLAGFESSCGASGGMVGRTPGQSWCTEYATYGPETREAFLVASAAAFGAEDHDKNGAIGPGEGQWLCRVPLKRAQR